eukprot:scaffold27570_cov34-Tisochrysis_lutea.AAC.1
MCRAQLPLDKLPPASAQLQPMAPVLELQHRQVFLREAAASAASSPSDEAASGAVGVAGWERTWQTVLPRYALPPSPTASCRAPRSAQGPNASWHRLPERSVAVRKGA